MKFNRPLIKQGLARALDWFDRQRFQVSGSLKASDICDGFDRSARRVPRNICADPAVEAKRAVSESLKTGLTAIRKSVLNCLNEADEPYLLEFASALKSQAAEYLGIEILMVVSSDGLQRQLQLSMSRQPEELRIQLRARRQTEMTGVTCQLICVLPDEPVRVASEADFSRLMGKGSAQVMGTIEA